uniref:Amidohydrolase family protein n=1 Tax=Neobacillus citreus TaxID=2833578 RepID=A0A942SX15_9BACI
MIIDAHHHLWDPADRPYPWMDDSVAPIRRRFDVDDLRSATHGTDVARTIVVQAVHDPGETRWLLSQPAPAAGVVGWVDLTAPDVADRLEALRAPAGHVPLVGIRHQAQDEPDPDWLARPDVVRGVRALAAADLPFDLLVRAREHEAAVALVDAVPDGRFVLDHAGKPDIADEQHEDAVADGWRRRMQEFAARPNVVCKVSGLLTEAGPARDRRPVARYVREAVETFGPHRSVFGSDWPVSTLAATYADTVNLVRDAVADLSEAERDAVFRATAAATYFPSETVQT